MAQVHAVKIADGQPYRASSRRNEPVRNLHKRV
jgi:hypothetical protein